MYRRGSLLSLLLAGLLVPVSSQQDPSPGVARPSAGLTNLTTSKLVDFKWDLKDSVLVDLRPETTKDELDANFKVNCRDCRTWGGMSAKFADQDPNQPSIQLIFDDFGGRFDFNLRTTGATTDSITLVAESELKVPPNKFHLANLIVSLDAVFQVSDAIDLDGGFQVGIPRDSIATFKITNKPEITHMDFDNSEVQSIPIKVNVGKAIVTVGLRVRVRADIRMNVQAFSNVVASRDIYIADQVTGAWVNLVEFTSDLTGDHARCPPAENWDINAGAYLADAYPNTTVVAPTASATYYQLAYTPECAATPTPRKGGAEPKTLERSGSPAAATATRAPAVAPQSTARVGAGNLTAVAAGKVMNVEDKRDTSAGSHGLKGRAAYLNRRSSPGAVAERAAAAPQVTPAPELAARHLGRRRVAALQASFFNNTSTATSCLVSEMNCPSDKTRHYVWTNTAAAGAGVTTPAGTGAGTGLVRRATDAPRMTDGTRLSSLAAPVTHTYEADGGATPVTDGSPKGTGPSAAVPTAPKSGPAEEAGAAPTSRALTTATFTPPPALRTSSSERRSSVVPTPASSGASGGGFTAATRLLSPTGTGGAAAQSPDTAGSYFVPRQPSKAPVLFTGAAARMGGGLGYGAVAVVGGALAAALLLV